MPRLDREARARVVVEFEKTKNLRLVAERLHLNIKTVRRWVKRDTQGVGLCDLKRSGRPNLLSAAAAQGALDMLESGDYSGCDQVASELQKQGLATRRVHRGTVASHVKALAAASGHPIRAVRTKPKKQLTADTKAKRLAFCQANITRNWRLVMFTDRKKFLFKHPGVKVHKVQWIRKGAQRTAHTVNHPMCLNIYAGVTKFGMTRAHAVAGTSKMASKFKNQKGQTSRNITAHEYQQVVLKTLLPEGKRIFSSQGISNWFLQQDNYPTHKKAATSALQAWNTHKAAVTILHAWPPNSPDLSPIENIWGWAQQKVDAAGCKTFDEFKATVLKTLQSVPKQMITNLFASMKGRLDDCIASGGAKTTY